MVWEREWGVAQGQVQGQVWKEARGLMKGSVQRRVWNLEQGKAMERVKEPAKSLVLKPTQGWKHDPELGLPPQWTPASGEEPGSPRVPTPRPMLGPVRSRCLRVRWLSQWLH